ncbi:MAG TPA: replicative DNA helicase [Bacteroidales bacterium]|nr:replicative DNA helicase [Bacteroidales bacterium]
MAEKKKHLSSVNLVQIPDKMPPQAIEIEQAVLGAILLNKDAMLEANQHLKPESFYSEKHQIIFSALQQLSKRLEPVDILTLSNELRKIKKYEEVGGAAYLSLLSTKVASSANLEYHAKIVAQKYIQRELIRVATDMLTHAYDSDADVADLLDRSERLLFEVAEGNIKKQTQKIKQILDEAVKRIDESGKQKELVGVPSGFTDIDRITSGWQPSDLIIIAARPSMGKTAFVLSMAKQIAFQKIPVAIFSLEMSDIQLVNRLIVSETRIPAEKIRTGKLADHEWTQLEKTIQPLYDAPIFIDDTPALNIFELRSKCRRLKIQYDIKIVIIDYLQLMRGDESSKFSREQEVSTISRSLKALAKELNVPIVALSQLNRSVETRAGHKRPQLSDLRESGAIEQDADLVLFIHRPEKMGITEDKEGNSTKGLAEILIEKHRNGATGLVPLRFIERIATFVDFDAPLDPLESNLESLTLPSKNNDLDSSFDNLMPNDILNETEDRF